MINTYQGLIKNLKENQVFIYHSNKFGFHGAGAAGYATFGVSGNKWRAYKYDEWPDGTKGRWNVKGVSEGFQEGTCGKSYAIPTVVRPGYKRSIPLSEIKESVAKFYEFALNEGSKYTFLVAQGVGQNLNGYSTAEMAEVYGDHKEIPSNICFQQEFTELLKQLYE